MTSAPEPGHRSLEVRADLVEYLIVTVADLAGLPSVAGALTDLVSAGTVRVLDVVVLDCGESGDVTVREVEALPQMAALDGVLSSPGLLSERDIELSSFAVPRGEIGVVVVTEDRWAAPLSAAAEQAGGRIVAGDRIPARRIEAALTEQYEEQRGGP
jgi:hypothetical protein